MQGDGAVLAVLGTCYEGLYWAYLREYAILHYVSMLHAVRALFTLPFFLMGISLLVGLMLSRRVMVPASGNARRKTLLVGTEVALSYVLVCVLLLFGTTEELATWMLAFVVPWLGAFIMPLIGLTAGIAWHSPAANRANG